MTVNRIADNYGSEAVAGFTADKAGDDNTKLQTNPVEDFERPVDRVGVNV